MKHQRGFTLIELMVAVAIIAILSAVAYPSYQESVRKSKRASAKARMSEVAGREQQFYSEAGGAATYTIATTALQYPAGDLYSETRGHVITVEAGADGIGTTFLITATPVSDDPVCGNLTLDHLGTFLPANC
ncbi:MAG: type IV pilin protein [Pseudomonadota bacterium]